MVSEDVKSEKELNIKDKRQIIVKKIANLLIKEDKILKKGHLHKKNAKRNKLEL